MSSSLVIAIFFCTFVPIPLCAFSPPIQPPITSLPPIPYIAFSNPNFTVRMYPYTLSPCTDSSLLTTSLTETWFSPQDSQTPGAFGSKSCLFFHTPQPSGSGGAVGVFFVFTVVAWLLSFYP